MDENYNNQNNNQTPDQNQYGQQYDQNAQQYDQNTQQYAQNTQQYQQPQQNNYYNNQGYQQPYNNYQPPVPTQPKDNSKNLAIASLVLGIVSFFCCGSVCSIVGIVLGAVSRKKKPNENGMATAGIVLSIIALVLWAIYFVVYVCVLGGTISTASHSYYY